MYFFSLNILIYEDSNLKVQKEGRITFCVSLRDLSSDLPCKHDNARFTTVPVKALSDPVW